MSLPREPDPAMLLVGLICRHDRPHDAVAARLARDFGPVADTSASIPFDFTGYYTTEMGEGLVRVYLAFERLVAPDSLPDLKLRANAIEQEYLDGASRTVNIDPGLLTSHNLVLATCKAFSHRIYLRDGIHAQLALMARKGRFEPLPWTYPDYKLPTSLAFFNAQRERFAATRRAAMHSIPPS